MTDSILVMSQPSSNTDEQQKNYLSFLVAQKIIKQFLTCDRVVTVEVRRRKFTKRELAEKLSISQAELEVFIKPSCKAFYKKSAGKISLPLVKLYCNTKWASSGK